MSQRVCFGLLFVRIGRHCENCVKMTLFWKWHPTKLYSTIWVWWSQLSVKSSIGNNYSKTHWDTLVVLQYVRLCDFKFPSKWTVSWLPAVSAQFDIWVVLPSQQWECLFVATKLLTYVHLFNCCGFHWTRIRTNIMSFWPDTVLRWFRTVPPKSQSRLQRTVQ